MKRKQGFGSTKYQRSSRKKVRATRPLARPPVRRVVYGVPPSAPRELKFIDVTGSAAAFAIAGTGVLTLLNGCIQGTDAINRVGRRIFMKSLMIRMGAVLGATGVSQGIVARVIVVYDKQPNGAAFAAADYLVTDSFSANHQLNNRERFVTCMDKVIGIPSHGGLVNFGFKKYKRLNMDTTYNTGNAGTVGDIQTGSLYMYTVMMANAVTVVPFTTTILTRIRFEDA